jgi:RNA polymerase sigma factor (sigma-70 family)
VTNLALHPVLGGSAVAPASRTPFGRLCQSGSTEADRRLRTAVAAHSDRLQRVLGRTGIGSGEAEELAQEAFWVLARRLSEVPERAERSFLVSTALRLAADRKRSAWHASTIGLTDPQAQIDAGPLADELVDAGAATRLVEETLEALPEAERGVFVLAELEGLSRTEIAETLALPEGTVASRLARARDTFGHTLDRARRRSCAGATIGVGPRPAPRVPAEIWGSRAQGDRRYESNPWGMTKARGWFDQRLVERTRDGRVEIGWTWRWPGFDPSSYAYPEVVIGWKPWLGGKPTDRRFPLRIGEIRRLELGYRVSTRAFGSYNLAVSTWIMEGETSLAANPMAIRSEVMFWLDASPGARPLGRLVDVQSFDGERFELFRAEDVSASYRDGRGWPLLTFRRQANGTCGTIDLDPPLAHLVRIGAASTDQYLACIELGNEIQGGAGATWVERVDLDLG